ncbi:MAG: DegT/DnrJ/EryC1/StrS family aminotransferase [Acidobacteria bacterium]|nr:DegT/DnrJ/EryC1/StrS family aminotransferase [Acidobacteriota bacterium]
MKRRFSRRSFLNRALTATAFTQVTADRADQVRFLAGESTKPAILGGSPVRSTPFPTWPLVDGSEERQLLGVLHSRKWNRMEGSTVARFEREWAGRLGAEHVLATSSGTSALACAVNALDIGPGDEVLVPPYTFVATINAVLMQHALPVFVDTDRETMQINASKIESAITPRTRAILPVHLGGSVADMDTILSIAARRRLPVIEDACQSHLAEWRGKKVGTLGDLGCFSLQASKNLNSGEGGVVVARNSRLIEICRSFHNQGRGQADTSFAYVRNGDNRRLTEFQGAILLAQLARLEDQARRREENALYLTSLLRQVPGIIPARMYEGVTRNAYHLYMFRYDPSHFKGLSRSRFLQALKAEGIPCGGGYSPLYREPFLENTLNSRAYRYIYSPKQLETYRQRLNCPQNDLLCAEAVWFTQTMFLGEKSDMDQIAAAITKIHHQAGELVTKAG